MSKMRGWLSYGWTIYDVRKGGTQTVNDTGNSLDLTIDFAKFDDEKGAQNWGLRIRGILPANAPDDRQTTVVFYLGNEDPNSKLTCRESHTVAASDSNVECVGTLLNRPKYKLQFLNSVVNKGSVLKTAIRSLMIAADTIWEAKTIFTDLIKDGDSRGGIVAHQPGEANLHCLQQEFKGGFAFDVLFSSDPEIGPTTSFSLDTGIEIACTTFRERFDAVYAPKAPFQDKAFVQFFQSLLSILTGGIGYFHGNSTVDTSSLSETTASTPPHAVVGDQGPFQLLSAVPSRPFFPSGILWDEGYHLLVILDWDMDLALEIVSSWFDLMDENGWIAREQILGPEARSKVPVEFQIQYPDYASPPTLFPVVHMFLAILSGISNTYQWS